MKDQFISEFTAQNVLDAFSAFGRAIGNISEFTKSVSELQRIMVTNASMNELTKVNPKILLKYHSLIKRNHRSLHLPTVVSRIKRIEKLTKRKERRKFCVFVLLPALIVLFYILGLIYLASTFNFDR